MAVLGFDEKTVQLYLREGSYFGELAALLGGKRQHSIVALTHCFLYSLKHDARDAASARRVEVRGMLCEPRGGVRTPRLLRVCRRSRASSRRSPP